MSLTPDQYIGHVGIVVIILRVEANHKHQQLQDISIIVGRGERRDLHCIAIMPALTTPGLTVPIIVTTRPNIRSFRKVGPHYVL